MKDIKDFEAALENKRIPLLVLDQKWHRLFAVHGKTGEIKSTEEELNALLARQGKLNSEIKKYKVVKNKLMESIVQNMEGTTDSGMESVREKKLDDNKKKIDEANAKIDEMEEELVEIPEKIRSTNERLMLLSMDYFYSKIRENKQESQDIEDFIKKIRVELKKSIIRKQNCDINNREIYLYLHDIFGAEVLDLFDMKYEQDEEEENKEEKQ